MKHEGTVDSAAFSPDGTRVVTASNGNTVQFWSANFWKGTGFSIGCEILGSQSGLEEIEAKYRLKDLSPICGDNAPLPVVWIEVEQ